MSRTVKNDRTDCSTVKIENEIIISVLTSNVKEYIHEFKFKTHHKPRRKKFCFLCRSQTNSLLLVLGAYVTIFSIASIILIMSVLRLQNLSDVEKFNLSSKTSDYVNISNHESSLNKISSLFSKKLFKEFMWPFKSSTFNCSSLSEVKKFNYLRSGWTKNVFSFKYNSKNYALKTVNVDGVDMKSCMEKHSTRICFEKASSKIYKEYILSRELSHVNIIKVLAWCVSSNFFNDVVIVTELCTPIDIITLLRMSFAQRLKIVVDLSHLMAYLADSPIGSIGINDFQRQQFVLCGKTLKLTDLDDLSIEEPKCNNHKQCSQHFLTQHLNLSSANEHQIKCINNLCTGYNEKQNVINTYKHFVNLFLNITTPKVLKKDVEALLDIYTSTWDGKAVLKQTEYLYLRFKNLQNSDA